MPATTIIHFNKSLARVSHPAPDNPKSHPAVSVPDSTSGSCTCTCESNNLAHTHTHSIAHPHAHTHTQPYHPPTPRVTPDPVTAYLPEYFGWEMCTRARQQRAFKANEITIAVVCLKCAHTGASGSKSLNNTAHRAKSVGARRHFSRLPPLGSSVGWVGDGDGDGSGCALTFKHYAQIIVSDGRERATRRRPWRASGVGAPVVLTLGCGCR